MQHGLDIGIVLLAAGSSSRMGQSKQLLQIGNEPLLVKSINAALHSNVSRIVVVLGDQEQKHRATINHLPTEILVNKAWNLGMGSSIKCGLNFLLKGSQSLNGVIILVCDQPLLTSAHINNLIEKHLKTRKPIVASHYADTNGVPVFFEKKYFDQLRSLDDADGAKKIIQKNNGDVANIAFPEGEIDLDTMEDYYRFTQHPGEPGFSRK